MLKLKLLFCILFQLTSICKVKSNIDDISVNSISKVISEVIREFYTSKNIKFDFIVYGKTSNQLNDVIDKVLMETAEENPTTLTQISNIDSWNHQMNQSAVFFIKTAKNFRNPNQKSLEIKSSRDVS